MMVLQKKNVFFLFSKFYVYFQKRNYFGFQKRISLLNTPIFRVEHLEPSFGYHPSFCPSYCSLPALLMLLELRLIPMTTLAVLRLR